ncbi:HlyD family secretion protein [Sphingomonas sp. PAMC26645]|uniref:HlyD family secretion protein n=1 Tax=Sphingomonas sp. PAMC26645 TaxID=2565555 RepID=UPI00109E1BC2|nr:HlyD family secretion protein [Sphingomonas sp. PAMC26645]QCB43394.1 HlyD family secretion protein [Sphingomonas sp. PAMC26645]
MTDQTNHSDANHDDEDRKDDPNGEDQQSDTDQQDESDDGKDEGDDKKPSVFKKPLFWIILVIVVGGLIIGGVLYWLHARQFESTDDAFVDTHIVRLAPQVAGTLVQVADIDNRHVEAGRLLAVIKASGRDAQVAEAQANESQARAQFAQAQAQVTAAEAQRQQAAAQARVPMAAAVKAQQDLARYEALLRLDPSAVAGQQLDQARATARQTAADAAAAREQIDTATAQISVARKQVGAAKSVIDARRAQVDQANVTIGDLRLTAPVAGQVVNRSVNVGSYVAPGTQLMAIVPDTMWVTANFKETQLTLMKIGQPVEIHVDAYPGVDFKGHVESIQRGAGQAFALLPPQNATGNYVKVVQRVPVRIVFDAKNGPDPKRYPIGPGMSVVPTVKVR